VRHPVGQSGSGQFNVRAHCSRLEGPPFNSIKPAACGWTPIGRIVRAAERLIPHQDQQLQGQRWAEEDNSDDFFQW